VPEINHKEATFGYRIFREVDGIDVEFLDNLSNLGFLEKMMNNKFLICPEHQSSFLVSVRISCPKCNSINVEKLHLLEHKACGFISEKKHYLPQPDDEIKCPSCKKMIKNQEKELRLPASWYLCNDCTDKFDEAKISLHCNEFNHDFTVTQASSVGLYNYVLSDFENSLHLDQSKTRSEISKVLSKHGYVIHENYTVQGKSGIDHNVDLAGLDSSGAVFVFVNNSAENNSEVDSKLIQILDTTPKVAILVGFSSISEKTISIASKYNLAIVSSQNIDEISTEIDKILVSKVKKLETKP
jgi:ribosomal protein S8